METLQGPPERPVPRHAGRPGSRHGRTAHPAERFHRAARHGRTLVDADSAVHTALCGDGRRVGSGVHRDAPQGDPYCEQFLPVQYAVYDFQTVSVR